MSRLFCGVDFHKRTCTIHVINESGKQIGKTKRVDTDRLLIELGNLRDVIVGIECSGGVNHQVDLLKGEGIDVRIINSNRARAIGYGGKKTDEKDAKMIAELLRADMVPEVSHRSKAARNMSLLITAREQLVQQRTSLICHIRGLLREYGLTMKTGVDSFFNECRAELAKLKHQNSLLHDILLKQFERCLELKSEELEINAKIEKATCEDQRISRLRDIPGLGLLGAYLMVAVVDDVTRFSSASSFASYLGLVPREDSSGDRRRLGSVTKAGNETLRRYLIHGARAILNSKNYKNDPVYIWAKRIEAKRGTNKASVALAHKLSRICFALLRDSSGYGDKVKSHKKAA